MLDATSSQLNGHRLEESEQAFQSLYLQVIYDADPRPTFVIDTTVDVQSTESAIVYTNHALSEHKDLLTCVRDAAHAKTGFYAWAVSAKAHKAYHRYGGVPWFGFMLQGRWKVVGTASSCLGLDGDWHNTLNHPKPVPTSSPCEGQASREDAVRELQEELRVRERGHKQAVKEKQSRWESVQRVKEELHVLESNPPHEDTPQLLPERSKSVAIEENTDSKAVAPTTTLPPPQLPDRSELRRSLSEYPPRQRSISPDIRRESVPTFQIPCKKISPFRSTTHHDAASLALEKFQRLAEAVDVGFFDYDLTGRLTSANDSWYNLSGHPRDPEQHTALTFSKCIYPDDVEMVMGNWDKLMKGQSVTFEMRWKKPPPPWAHPEAPPEAQWVLAACVPVISENGEVQSVSGCTTDINAQKQSAQVAMQRAEALERARASEERFARFAEVAPIAIFRFDKSKNLEYCNDRWFEMTGIPRSQFGDIAWPCGVFDEDVDMCSAAWKEAIARRSIGQIEFRLQKEWSNADGRRGQTWAYCTFFAEFADDGSFSGLMGSLLDISHLKWAENMQKLRAEEALEAKRQQEAFIDITSHEMRNPLSAMVQCADSIIASLVDTRSLLAKTSMLRTSAENALFKDHIDVGLDSTQTILSCAAHQKRIVDDILTLSKLDSNLLLITPVKTEPAEMARNVIKMFEMDSVKADVNLTLELHDSLQLLQAQWLMLDPSRVSQILINLLGNAIKFTRTGRMRKVVVRVSASADPPSRHNDQIDYVPAEMVVDDLGDGIDCNDSKPVYLKLAVQDTGCGLTPEEKVKLFMRFSQASPKTHVKYGGSGLGLFISRKLTEMQGGEIGFASEISVGSTFAFYIKTKRTTASVDQLDLGIPEILRDPSSTRKKGKGKHDLNVLLVEDNLVNQKVLSTQLRKQGCNVFVAGHGVEALDFLKTTELWSDQDSRTTVAPASEPVSLDVVLMDIEMPVMGGLECTTKIRQLEFEKCINKHLPIISISANARQEQVNEAKTAGVDDTITKPFRIQELMPKLNRLVSMS